MKKQRKQPPKGGLDNVFRRYANAHLAQIQTLLRNKAVTSHVALAKLARRELEYIEKGFAAEKKGSSRKRSHALPPTLTLIEAEASAGTTLAPIPQSGPALSHANGSSECGNYSYGVGVPVETLFERFTEDGSTIRSIYLGRSGLVTSFFQALTSKDDPDLTDETLTALDVIHVIDDGLTVSKKLWRDVPLGWFLPGGFGSGMPSQVDIAVGLEFHGYTFGFPDHLEFSDIRGAGISSLTARLVGSYARPRSGGTMEMAMGETNLACRVLSSVVHVDPGQPFGFGVQPVNGVRNLSVSFVADSSFSVNVWLQVELTIGVSKDSNLTMGAVFAPPTTIGNPSFFVHVPWKRICTTGMLSPVPPGP